jgi:hypothetical protein
MKKIFISFLALSSVVLLMLSSCKKDETKAYSSIGGTGTLSASTTSPALSKANADANAITFNWQSTTVTGNASAISYTLQFDKKGNNFAAVREIAVTGTTQSVTQGAMNTVLLNLGLPDGVAASIETRLKSVIAPNAAPAYSNVLTLTVIPYSLISYIYVPGAYQGWDPAKAPTLASATSNGIYTGIITVPASSPTLEFKIAPAPNWNTSYGGAAGVLSTSGPNIFFPSAGNFKVDVNLNTLTYSVTKQ